jgi:predicted nucleic acid-binding protein
MGALVCDTHSTVADALARIPRDQVPDLPDRVIAAAALALGLPLVTRDAKIRSSAIQTIW